MPSSTRLAVDIGGTFTDIVLDRNNRNISTKLLTTHDAPERAVIEGARAIMDEAGVSPADLDLVIHGTTLATNALIERKGARTGLITTAGFRDSLEMAYEHRFEQYDLYMERPSPLVERDFRFEVPERMAADGSVLLDLDEDALRDLVGVLRTRSVETIAISFLHSYINPEHEERARAIIKSMWPEVAISISSEVCREIREYERTSTTVANAYVQKLMEGYLSRMKAGLSGLGSRCPLLLMMSSGGITTVETAIRFPIRLVESGPAGGAILARHIAANLGARRAIAFDMGGTTAKLTLIDDFMPQHSRHFEIARAHRFVRGSGIPVRIPVIDMVEIGAGGGSIARVDQLGRITVGPDSAGSEPGPACYDRGGEAATVTDADLVLGRIDPRRFAAGKVPLNGAKAGKAIDLAVAHALKMSTEEAARAVSEIVDETMASAARVHAVENGKETAGRTLIAFGGAAPLHAVRLAQKLGIDKIVIPADAGVGSALGFLEAPIAYEVVRTRLLQLASLDPTEVGRLFRDMRQEAEAVVRLGAPDAPLEETRIAFMRYKGQGHEVPVSIDARKAIDAAGLRSAFEQTYTQLYGRIIPHLEIEALTWILSLSERHALPAASRLPEQRDAPPPSGVRRIVDSATGQAQSAAEYARAALPAGTWLAGPAIILEDGTSTVIPANFSLRVGASNELVITETGKETSA